MIEFLHNDGFPGRVFKERRVILRAIFSVEVNLLALQISGIMKNLCDAKRENEFCVIQSAKMNNSV